MNIEMPITISDYVCWNFLLEIIIVIVYRFKIFIHHTLNINCQSVIGKSDVKNHEMV